jgi:hypothetical protein
MRTCNVRCKRGVRSCGFAQGPIELSTVIVSAPHPGLSGYELRQTNDAVEFRQPRLLMHLRSYCDGYAPAAAARLRPRSCRDGYAPAAAAMVTPPQVQRWIVEGLFVAALWAIVWPMCVQRCALLFRCSCQP